MNHLAIITAAYDKCGILYVIRSEEEYQYLILVGTLEQQLEFQTRPLDEILHHGFMEFDKGLIASY